MKKRLSHVDKDGAARMVDVAPKPVTHRIARAGAVVTMSREAFAAIRDHRVGKGNVLDVARIAGISAGKQTAQLIPLCHPVALTHLSVDLTPAPPDSVEIQTRAEGVDRTGVEMEAMTAAAVAALTVYDMCKALDRSITIGELRLEEKSGGRSGRYRRKQ